MYDLCYCLEATSDAITIVAAEWRSRRQNLLLEAAINILKEKFASVGHFGPAQFAVFHDSRDEDERAMHARRAFELVQKLLSLL